ncbi:MAG: universal stress protein [Acidimicrobiia bacterium]|nr:universal stress protein [Acidimicrobiia bacterium]
MTGPFTVLVATDGSRSAHSGIALARILPWPDGTRVVGLVATAPPPILGLGRSLRGLLTQAYEQEAQQLRSRLESRFADFRVALVRQPPAAAILEEQRRCGADVIVLGSRGLGPLGRLALGSVSRRIVREAPCAVLVVKKRVRAVRRIVIAVDGSPAATRGVRLIERMSPSSAIRLTVAGVAASLYLPPVGRVPPGQQAAVRRGIQAGERTRVTAVRRRVDAAARRLAREGWKVTTDVRLGRPLDELLAAVSKPRADLVVCGAASVSGVKRMLLGSVADGLVDRAAASVLVAR